MAALVIVRNDGPDAVELRIGRQSILLYAGKEYRVATNHTVEVLNLPKISAEDLALHMSGPRMQTEKNRYAED
jgi:hypothetical protein